nr:hypothetical protein [Bacillus wiedmannii]
MKQLAFLPVMDKEMEKKMQKEVVRILKEYRALKARFENELEQQQEEISLFPEIRNTRHVSKYQIQTN